MSPIDDELRALMSARADVLSPSPDPLADIERRASRIRRNRMAASVAGAALAVAAIAVAVPGLVPDRSGGNSVTPGETPPASPSPSASATTEPGSGAALDPNHPWHYRGDPALRAAGNLESLQQEWRTSNHPASRVTALFGQTYEPSGRTEIVFMADAKGVYSWGVATSSESGWEFGFERSFQPGVRVLMAALPGDEVPRLLVIAAPSTGDISYAVDGRSFTSVPMLAPGVGQRGLVGKTPDDAVRVLDGNGNLDAPVFLGPAPDFLAPGSGPHNRLLWQPRGEAPDDALVEQAMTAFARGVGVKRDSVEGTVLYASNDRGGTSAVFGQAWFAGEPARTFGYSVDAHGVATPFLGPGIPQEPAVLAFLVPASAMGSPDTLILLPQPGIGTVSYAASVVDPYSVVANGRSDLNGVGIVDRDPRAATDRIEVRSADGTVVFRSGVQALLCGAKSCG